MHTKEQKILKFSMMLLFLALMIVYTVWYQVKGNELKKSVQSQNSGSSIQILSKSGDVMTTIASVSRIGDLGFSQNTGNVISTGNVVNTGKLVNTGDVLVTTNKTGVTASLPQTTPILINKNNNIKLLSGTSIYYGSIATIEKLGIKYQYALTDEKGIWYIYLGTPSYDFVSIARALKGTLYTLATEQDILDNKLFGSKVVFINLPENKDKQVLMLMYLNDGIRLIQMEYSIYHKSKTYLKSLFTD